MYSVNHACEHTKFKDSINFLIKITGRYYVPLFENHLISIDIKNRTRNIHTVQNENSIIGLHQNYNTERREVCEILGIHILFFYFLFHMNLSDDSGSFFPHVETIYYNRLKSFDPNKILSLPTFPIEPTQMGGCDVVLSEL